MQKLDANPDALGIFGFSFLDQNTDKIQGSFVDGVEPTFEAIADGQYPVSRPLFFYVKKAHAEVIPGIKEYLAEFTSEKAWGTDGYLAEKGMIPMPDDERKAFGDAVKNLEPFICKSTSLLAGAIKRRPVLTLRGAITSLPIAMSGGRTNNSDHEQTDGVAI